MATSPTSSPTERTTLVVEETAHARQRRAERGIDKKDLEAALRFGKQVPCNYGVKIYYEGLYYVVKWEKPRIKEITCFADSVNLKSVKIPQSLLEDYQSKRPCLNDMSMWNSNTVIVVDTSGSMRKSDVWGARTRLSAVWMCLALDFVAHRIESGEAGPYDVVFGGFVGRHFPSFDCQRANHLGTLQ
mmetsp:Transcript_24849/g.68830  ORF Transcript_24849/g.68830 Transcript_24849/m.68830 type:complete len:187 (-) Transcript_24849:3278-3838(-)